MFMNNPPDRLLCACIKKEFKIMSSSLNESSKIKNIVTMSMRVLIPLRCI